MIAVMVERVVLVVVVIVVVVVVVVLVAVAVVVVVVVAGVAAGVVIAAAAAGGGGVVVAARVSHGALFCRGINHIFAVLFYAENLPFDTKHVYWRSALKMLTLKK